MPQYILSVEDASDVALLVGWAKAGYLLQHGDVPQATLVAVATAMLHDLHPDRCQRVRNIIQAFGRPAFADNVDAAAADGIDLAALHTASVTLDDALRALLQTPPDDPPQPQA
jgi:hypothetical protein